MGTITGLVGWNSIAGGVPNTNTGAVRGGGTAHSNLDLTSLASPSEFDGGSETVADAVANQNVASGTDGTVNVGAATQIRSRAETNAGDEIQDDSINRLNTWREPNITGLSVLRDGRFVDGAGNITNYPVGNILTSGEITAGEGDTAYRTREEGVQTYNYSVGGNPVEKNLPTRNG